MFFSLELSLIFFPNFFQLITYLKSTKVKELESKFRERQQSDSATFQQKVCASNFDIITSVDYLFLIIHLNLNQVKDLENKLKDQVQESESHSAILQQKVVKDLISLMLIC